MDGVPSMLFNFNFTELARLLTQSLVWHNLGKVTQQPKSESPIWDYCTIHIKWLSFECEGMTMRILVKGNKRIWQKGLFRQLEQMSWRQVAACPNTIQIYDFVMESWGKKMKLVDMNYFAVIASLTLAWRCKPLLANLTWHYLLQQRHRLRPIHKV